LKYSQIGIGGVHRDFTDSMDVSADLIELSKTKVAVISSGVKSILDIGKTLGKNFKYFKNKYLINYF
jgi:pseudouridine-5'-phosphate glycosidase